MNEIILICIPIITFIIGYVAGLWNTRRGVQMKLAFRRWLEKGENNDRK